ncbi:MAG TPA: ubiquinol-cytochrome C chaperone family protein [Rhodopila sp.]|uniref:ubiquinol-cytochrome C chaperone family protein n=1 Tax=Rhodopila sp. TaxID=2480087 RepID=UPI002B694C2C|nr:ubiquinol-cytochrome C chaperone family protein [Rhodopila sp.]HVY15627.1 ubiquinol-cytochrome C chaperone family protein [Rhodopila sp.]
MRITRIKVAGLFSRRGKHERAAYQLYGSAVAAARDPYLYATLGVPDTLDGRFDSICLHVYVVIRRLNQESPAATDMAQAVFDAMFHDMDINLREMGVGDMSVGKRNRKMWEAFHGRSAAYAGAWNDEAALAAALGRNFWRGAEPPAGSAAALVRLAKMQETALRAQPASALMAGTVQFQPAEEAAH